MADRAPSRQGRLSTTAWLKPETMRAFSIFCARMGMSKERALEYILENTLTSDGETKPWIPLMRSMEKRRD